MLFRPLFAIIFLFTCASFASSLPGQIHRLSTQEGLSQVNVNQIVEDKFGFIWLATEQGLNRYDGISAKLPKQLSNFLEKQIFTIKLIDDTFLLVSTHYDGSFLINTETLTSTQIYSGRLNEHDSFISPIGAAIKVGNFIYAGIDNYVYQISMVTYESRLVASFNEKNFIRSFALNGEQLFIGTSKGLFSLSLQLELIQQLSYLNESASKLSHNVKLLKHDEALGLLIGTVEGLYVAPKLNGSYDFSKAYTYIEELNIWDHQLTPHGEFIATELGLFEIDRKNKLATHAFSLSTSQFNLTENSILDIQLDQHNVLWMATPSGAYYWATSARKFNALKAQNEQFVSHNVWSIFQKDNGDIIAGTNNGFTLFPKSTKGSVAHHYQSTNVKDEFGKHAVYSIFALPRMGGNSFLLDTQQGLKQFNTVTNIVSPPQVNDPNKAGVFLEFNGGAYEVSKGKIAFIGKDDYYLYNLEDLTLRIIEGLAEQLPVPQGYRFLETLPTHPNEFVLSTTKGLYRFNEATKTLTSIFVFSANKENEFKVVDDWAVVDETLWLATSHHGLQALDLQSYQPKFSFDNYNAMKKQSLYELQPDEFGFLWISAQTGLYRLNLNSKQLDKYTISNGLPDNEFNAGASLTLFDGQIAFGTASGIVLLEPEDFTQSDQASSVLSVTNIELMSRPLAYSPSFLKNNQLVLNHDDVGLSVEFSNFDFTEQFSRNFYARLVGRETTELTINQDNRLFFPTLPAGSYELIIEERSLDNQTTFSQVSVPFNVEYAPLNSPIAWLIYASVLGCFLLLSFYQGKRRQITIHKALLAVTTSKQQTEMALKSTKSGTWKIDLNKQLIFQNRNKSISKETGLQSELNIDKYLALIHKDDRFKVQNAFEQLKTKNDAEFNVTYRLKDHQGQWQWFHDIGKITERDPKNKNVIAAGIFTNITERKATDLQANILGQAFSQIDEWLLILDHKLTPISVNHSFCEAFNLNESDALNSLSFYNFSKAVGSKKLRNLFDTVKSLKANQNYKIELSVRTQHHNSQPVHASINAIANAQNEIEHYVIVISDLTEQKKAENELRYLANYDSLTQLPNRSLMLQHIEFAIYKAQQNQQSCALLFIDLDKFKPINDAYGHQAGDKLLIKIAQRINSHLPDGCLLGRQSGDEFLVLIDNGASPQELSNLTNSLINTLPEKVDLDGISVSVSASIGVALYPFDADDSESLIRNADIAMIHAKQSGRNGYKYFTASMTEQFTKKLTLETALKTGYKDNAFFNHYQPIINVSSGQMVGVELLMRWQHKGENISPADFIPIAEETGLIELMTEQALKRAIVELQPLLRSCSQFYLSLNLAPVHILKDDTASNLKAILDSFNLPTDFLRLEITETSLMEDKEKAKASLYKLKEKGFKLLLDDFGTGYSSLTYLNQFPIDIIKIDQSFVRKMNEQQSNKSIVKTIHTLAENLNMFCIAEGVEEQEHMNFLTDLGCYYMQGYLFSKPLSIEALMEKEQNTENWRHQSEV